MKTRGGEGWSGEIELAGSRDEFFFGVWTSLIIFLFMLRKKTPSGVWLFCCEFWVSAYSCFSPVGWCRNTSALYRNMGQVEFRSGQGHHEFRTVPKVTERKSATVTTTTRYNCDDARLVRDMMDVLRTTNPDNVERVFSLQFQTEFAEILATCGDHKGELVLTDTKTIADYKK
jgi:hypothetical protein